MKFLKTLFTVGAISVMSICSLNALMPLSAKAQVPDGRYDIQGTQILFYPAGGGNPLLVYNGRGKATHIIQYGGAVYIYGLFYLFLRI